MNTRSDHAHMRTMHRRWLKWKWVRTWAVGHHALSRERVRAQLRNNLMHVTDQNKSIMHGSQINQSVNQSWSLICWAPTKAHFILHELIPIKPLFGITELIFAYFFLKNILEIMERFENRLPNRKWKQILLKEILIPKTLRNESFGV